MDPVFHVWLLYLAKFAVWLSDQITDLIFGWTFTNGTKEERERARSSFEHSAHVVSVVKSAAYHPEFPACDMNIVWVLKHVRYDSPRMLLENDQICLSHVTKDSAWFGIPRPREDVYDTKKYPFLPIGIHHASDHFVILPISSFHRIAEEAGDPKVTLGLSAMTNRSGSTLISQIMSRVPNTRSISEPFSIDTISMLYSIKEIDNEDLRKRFRNAIKLFARTQKNSKVERVFIKLNGFQSPFLDFLREDFPQAKIIQSSRHPINSLISSRKITATFYQTLHGKLGLTWNSHGVKGLRLFLNKFSNGRPKLYWFWQNISHDEVCVLWYAGGLACFREFKDVFDLQILYEDLASKPEETVTKLFETMDFERLNTNCILT